MSLNTLPELKIHEIFYERKKTKHVLMIFLSFIAVFYPSPILTQCQYSACALSKIKSDFMIKYLFLWQDLIEGYLQSNATCLHLLKEKIC